MISEFAQKTSFAKRKYDIESPITKDSERNDFSIDRDRILYSRSFRRLVHKAQIYSFEEGDHFRTRLTHTLEVSQIARSIARNLGLNEDLVEAIAIGHDVGHTPFGHTGECVLDSILTGENDIKRKIPFPLNHGGFKHNYNSLRILEFREKKFEGQFGLNLTWQVLEGILKHTKIRRKDKSWAIHRYCKGKNKKEIEKTMHFDKDFSVTLEGQAVAISDEIAQREHDLDDGLRDNDLRFTPDAIIDKLLEFAGKCKKDEPITILIDKLKKITLSKDGLYKKNSMVRNVIEYFITDLTKNSIKNINNIKKEDYTRTKDSLYFNKPIVVPSENGIQLNKDIENFIFNRIINTYKVNIFDEKATFIITKLFSAYYNNPRQMPYYVQKKIINGIKKNSNLYDIRIKKNNKRITEITFWDNPFEVDDVVSLLKLEPKAFEKIDKPEGLVNPDHEELRRVNSIDVSENEKERFLKCLIENNYVFLSCITDFISGMTDSYAKKEYKKLYLV